LQTDARAESARHDDGTASGALSEMAVLFAVVAAALFGGAAVAVRAALRRGGTPEAGATTVAAAAFAASTLLAAASGPRRSALAPHELWPFLLAGVLVPGISQLLFVRAVRDAGPSRTALVIGTAPVLSALLAVAFLGEPVRTPLVAGTLLIVLGGGALAWERVRPEGFRLVGLVLAFSAAVLFAVRDNVVRAAARDVHAPPLVAATASLATGAAVVLLAFLVSRRGRGLSATLPGFLPAGIVFGLAYDSLLEALGRGPVTVVAPLNATQSLWAVLLAALLLGRSEAVGARLLTASALILAGGVLVGVGR
jgi:drug/metabolite transporter (DMT)-like permease